MVKFPLNSFFETRTRVVSVTDDRSTTEPWRLLIVEGSEIVIQKHKSVNVSQRHVLNPNAIKWGINFRLNFAENSKIVLVLNFDIRI